MKTLTLTPVGFSTVGSVKKYVNDYAGYYPVSVTPSSLTYSVLVEDIEMFINCFSDVAEIKVG